jgi:DNA-binding NarL/FixJ family response regulator
MNRVNAYKDLTILIVEDDHEARDALRSMIELDFKYVYEAKDGCEGLELFQKYKPDIILTDIQMPCMTGMEMLSEIRKSSTDALAIFISAYSDIEILTKAIDLKIDAYIIKPFLYKDVLEKIDINLSSLSLKGSIHKELSKREFEVFIDIAKGVKPTDIASKYELKTKTVGTYRKRILQKLNMNSNAELIKYALKNNLI